MTLIKIVSNLKNFDKNRKNKIFATEVRQF